ncbi:uncharacterized protein LOC107267086 [Cephus cinctus]|uniref:Probable enoyl-CoA hydratase, mitochondrial n=1 Tax=Cephus cinctus TaxID=211228 RepID=A0AAJ7BTA5_CEPCN|nr:uncharacterized protein LOC107267086 [Cephus cinctus]
MSVTPRKGAVNKDFPWTNFKILDSEYDLVQCKLCKKEIFLTSNRTKILIGHMSHNHRNKISEAHNKTLVNMSKNSNLKRSFVWHYFYRLGDTAKCRVCQYEIRNKNSNTSSLIRHLLQVHKIKRGTMVNDLKELPTMPRQSSNMGSCMRERVFRSFEETAKGIWKCKLCSYVSRTKKLMTMFCHLKVAHWKANGPAYSDFVIESKLYPNIMVKEDDHVGCTDHDGSTVVLSSSEKSRTTDSGEPLGNAETYVLDDDLIARLSKSGSNNSNKATDTDQGNIAQIAANTSMTEKIITQMGAQGQNSTMVEPCIAGGNNCAVNINVIDNKNQIGCLVFRHEENIELVDQGQTQTQNSVNLDHNYHDESRTMSPVITIENSARDERNEHCHDDMDIQVPIDHERKFDHQYSRKSGARMSFARLSKTLKDASNDISIENKNIKGKNDVACISLDSSQVTCSSEISDNKEDFRDFELQVPLQNLQNVSREVRRGNNDPPSYYQYIKIEKAGEKQNVGVVTLNRPKTLNAICDKLMRELADAVKKFDKDASVGSIVITGNEKAFAAGTDVNELANITFSQTLKSGFMSHWATISKVTKPVIAAVNGYALGGGCELAMMCDIIYAGHKARFGQPEIILGYFPNNGGTQRLTRILGKSKAMEMILTGSQITAQEGEKLGLVSKVFPADRLLSEAIKLGEKISINSQLIMAMAKEAVNTAYETTLQEGLKFEKRLSYATFATADLKEGLKAFMEKRTPKFSNQ